MVTVHDTLGYGSLSLFSAAGRGTFLTNTTGQTMISWLINLKIMAPLTASNCAVISAFDFAVTSARPRCQKTICDLW